MSDLFRRTSKYMSLLLRHNPGAAGLSLDDSGWADVTSLLAALNENGHAITRAELDDLVSSNAKKRFAFDDTGTRIRAVQGHSIDVSLGYAPTTPPDILYHGTVARFLAGIKDQGLVPGSRNHVHLSVDVETARAVGGRRGKPLVLTIDTGAMHRDGSIFYLSDNGVWLTEHVSADYIVGWG